MSIAHTYGHLFRHAGELAQICRPALLAESPDVRASAASALGSVLLMSEVLEAAAANSTITAQLAEHWQALTDGLLDPSPEVVSAAATASVALLEAGMGQQGPGSAQQRTPVYLLQDLAQLTASRISCTLGPIIAASGRLSVPGHAAMAHLLALVVECTGASGTQGTPPAMLPPGISALAAGVAAHLDTLSHHAHPTISGEACRRLLQVALAVRTLGSSSGAGGSAAAVPLPPHLISDAVARLLALEETATLLEGAAEDLVGAAIQVGCTC